LPSKGREEKTSSCRKGKRRSSGLMAIYCSAGRTVLSDAFDFDVDGQNKSHQIPNQNRLQERKTGVSVPHCQLQSGVSHPNQNRLQKRKTGVSALHCQLHSGFSHPVSPKDGETRVGHPGVSDPHQEARLTEFWWPRILGSDATAFHARRPVLL